MTKTVKLTLAAGLLAVMAAAAAPALMAQDAPQAPPRGGWMGPGGPGGHGGPGRQGGPMGLIGPGFRGLDLTDAQREQVRAIMQSHQAEFTQVGEKVRAARDGMHALVNADTLDEAAIRAKATEAAAAEADAAILNAKVRAEVKGILTAEQLEKMKALQGRRRGARR